MEKTDNYKMKKILFIAMSLNIGGAEKSLVNLLNMIDYSKYEVDLFLFQKKGSFLKQVPSEVRLVENDIVKTLYQSASETLKQGKITLKALKLILIRYITSLYHRIKWRQFDQIRLHRWIENYSKVIPNFAEAYDVAVAYAGGDTAYYMFDKVDAKRKVYFFHSDYSNIDIDVELEKRYVNQADLIVTISEKCKTSLVKLFSNKKEQIVVLNNLSSAKLIKSLANEYYPKEYENKENIIKIVSVGRLINIKGFDMAVEAAKILKDKGYIFTWVVVGEGGERKYLETKIRQYLLDDYFVLVGVKENPYPYIQNADILLQTSRFEGKSVVLDEARILKTPVIVTNYNTAKDQVKNEIDGLIVDMKPNSIADAIEKCINNNEIIMKLQEGIFVDHKIENVSEYMECIVG